MNELGERLNLNRLHGVTKYIGPDNAYLIRGMASNKQGAFG